jgi:hypothetical protein
MFPDLPPDNVKLNILFLKNKVAEPESPTTVGGDDDNITSVLLQGFN